MQLITVLFAKLLNKCENDPGGYTVEGICYKMCNSENDCTVLKNKTSCYTFSKRFLEDLSNLVDQKNKNPDNLKICIPSMKKTRDLIPYGYKSFTIGTIKVSLYNTFTETYNCKYNSSWITDGSGLKIDTECYLKCEKDDDCQIAITSNPVSFSKQRCYPLVSQTDDTQVGICREDHRLYEWIQKSYKFIPFGFFPLVNIIEYEIDENKYELTETYKLDCKGVEFVTLYQNKQDGFSQGFCLPNNVSEFKDQMKSAIITDFLGNSQRRLII
jgi:hypothetical protein